MNSREVFTDLLVNGEHQSVEVERDTSLLNALRSLGLTGTTGACEEGECGSCTVLLDDTPICSCLLPAVVCSGKRIVSIEGVVDPALSDALIKHGAVQCGFCTPGFIVRITALLTEHEHIDRDRVREELAGNLCRCTGYEALINAVLELASPQDTRQR